MGITYTDKKKFTKERTRQLFRSVGWVSGKYPERLHKALMGSSTVFSAWDGDRLVGLVRVLDDTEMVAYMHYVLVDPEYQGYGIAGHLVVMVKEKYCDYLYIEVMPEESKNATFYQKHGFLNHGRRRGHADPQSGRTPLKQATCRRLPESRLSRIVFRDSYSASCPASDFS